MHFTASTSVTVHTFEIFYLISGKIFSYCPGRLPMLKIRCYMAILRCCWSHSKQSHICMELILPLNQLHIILPIYPISYREKKYSHPPEGLPLMFYVIFIRRSCSAFKKHPYYCGRCRIARLLLRRMAWCQRDIKMYMFQQWKSIWYANISDDRILCSERTI